MSVYDKAGEIRLLSAMLEAAQWELQDDVIEAAAIEVCGADEILALIERSAVLEWLDSERLKPEDLFEHEELEEWAKAREVEISEAKAASPLPRAPNTKAINELLIELLEEGI